MADESMARPCCELPKELAVLVFARVFYPEDRARFRAVCRTWRSATNPPPRQLPWIMHPVGGFLNPSDGVLRRLVNFHGAASSGSTDSARFHDSRYSFPEGTRCIGSTNGWIAINCGDSENRHKHRYLLHNEFSGTTLSLPELDAAIGHVSELFEIRKVLLRSTPDDVIAVMTNHRRCPIILATRGKGVWLPKWHAGGLIHIIDVAFLGDRLYGITRDEDLVFLDIASDDNGVPMVTGGECVIGKYFDVWSNEEYYEDYEDEDDGDDVASDDDDDDGDDVASDDDDGDDVSSDDDGDDDDDDDDEEEEEEDDDDDNEYGADDNEHTYDLLKMTDNDTTSNAIKYIHVAESLHELEPIRTMLYLIESRGKPLMMRRQVLVPAGEDDIMFTHKVEVFEADICAAKWVPMKGGLGGHALFISRPFCKSVPASCSKEIQEDGVYFIDTTDVFNMRSKTMSDRRGDLVYVETLRNCDTEELTWVFPPELVS